MAEVNGNGVNPHPNGTVPVMNGSSYAAKFQLADHFIGGNKLENAPASAVKDFVASHDGHTVITNVRINFFNWKRSAGEQLLTFLPKTGPDCKQRYCCSQGDPIRAKMGLRDLR
jgi:hypothetical protein